MSGQPEGPAASDRSELEAEIAAFVGEHDYVTFAALHRHFAGDARDDTEIALPGNRVIWRGLPRPVIDAVLALLDEQVLAAIPGHKAAYKKDGRVLPLPIEKAPPSEPHPSPHWFPVLLRTMAAVRAEEEPEAEAP